VDRQAVLPALRHVGVFVVKGSGVIRTVGNSTENMVEAVGIIRATLPANGVTAPVE